jgi:hypothetical protein
MQRRINTAARRDEPLIRDEAQVSVSASTAAGEATKEKDGQEPRAGFFARDEWASAVEDGNKLVKCARQQNAIVRYVPIRKD